MWTKDDVNWLKKNYPDLKKLSPKILEGQVSFRMIHDSGENIINPTAEHFDNLDNPKFYISDRYNIRIVWGENKFPDVAETSGRIKRVAQKYNLKLLDLHVYENFILCLACDQDLLYSFADKFSIDIYFNEYLIPFLFAQSFFEKYESWPWGELAHAEIGPLEWLGRRRNHTEMDIKLTLAVILNRFGKEKAQSLISIRCRPHKPCPCKSGKKNKDCHPDIKEAITLIRIRLSRGDFTLSDLAVK